MGDEDARNLYYEAVHDLSGFVLPKNNCFQVMHPEICESAVMGRVTITPLVKTVTIMLDLSIHESLQFLGTSILPLKCQALG
mmetsp:Transcript_11746/g.20690  ORF Transcript_11746/g.20690 Transcript_11746/m.20690 type:complete len:82 (-) Transcript_11746:610-855(-)